jgi:pRiA4b ORF-3-like protein
MVKTKDPGVVYQLKIALRDIKPPIWRRVLVKDCSLAELHDVIQTCMGWERSHMHAFEIGGQQYGELDPDEMMEMEDEKKAKLSQLAAQGVKKFSYTYDFGDNWDHTIEVEKVLDPEPGVRYPLCIAGKRACPPEDCGGPWGYANFLEAVQNPEHEEHADVTEWLGRDFDPEALDLEAVNKALR